MKRLLLADAQEGPATLEGPRFHHLVRVLRAQLNDTLEVFDGRGAAFDATVSSLEADRAALVLTNRRAAPPPRAITIVQGLPKAEKMEWVLQKGTELGATGFAPAACERSVVDLTGKEAARTARWQRIADEAARQCGRADVPTVRSPLPLLQAVAALKGATVLVLDEEERELSLSAAWAQTGGDAALALVVGPEGGLARSEVAALRAGGALGVSLGRLVLRTETAALAALSVLRHLDGELG